MENLMSVIMAFGIPSGLFGLFIWWFKRHIDKRDKAEEEKRKAEEARKKKQEVAREQREKNIETYMLMIAKYSRATHILAEATARAVQRIPDAHCNGDMTQALEDAEAIQKEEKNFLMDHGIKHIFEE